MVDPSEWGSGEEGEEQEGFFFFSSAELVPSLEGLAGWTLLLEAKHQLDLGKREGERETLSTESNQIQGRTNEGASGR